MLRNLYLHENAWQTANFSAHLFIYIDGLMQERRNSIAKALELRLSCINPSIWWQWN